MSISEAEFLSLSIETLTTYVKMHRDAAAQLDAERLTVVTGYVTGLAVIVGFWLQTPRRDLLRPALHFVLASLCALVLAFVMYWHWYARIEERWAWEYKKETVQLLEARSGDSLFSDRTCPSEDEVTWHQGKGVKVSKIWLRWDDDDECAPPDRWLPEVLGVKQLNIWTLLVLLAYLGAAATVATRRREGAAP